MDPTWIDIQGSNKDEFAKEGATHAQPAMRATLAPDLSTFCAQALPLGTGGS